MVSKLMIQESLSQERSSSRSENRSQSNRNWLRRQSAMSYKRHLHLSSVLRTVISSWVAKTECQGLRLITNIHRLYHNVWGFGAIHCIACFFFPTHVELSIRRISSVVITTVSIYIFLLAAWLDNMDFNTASDIVLHLDLCPEVSRMLWLGRSLRFWNLHPLHFCFWLAFVRW